MFEKEPLVSIILPTYNRADFLKEAIDSVIKQTYTNWELIIWDDGSTDNTKEIVANCHDPRIFYYCSVNQGVSSSRNSSMLVSKGELIAFLDSDDTWHPEKLQKQILLINDYLEIDIIFTDFRNINIVDGFEGFGFKQNTRGLKNLQVSSLANNSNLILNGLPESLLISNFIATDSVLLRKSIFDQLDMFNKNLRNGEDIELWWRIALNKYKFAFIDEALLIRRKGKHSLSNAEIVTYENLNRMLSICLENSKIHNSPHHELYIRGAIKKNLLGKLKIYALMGDLKNAIQCFRESIKNRITIRDFYLLFGSFYYFIVGKKS